MNTTNVKPFVFVLMPFHSDFDDIYQVGIKASCLSAGAYCERVDEQIFIENILERVYNQIAKADIVIAEMTGRNPNVFYETGYAHALNKRVILLTQNSDDIPFDLKHYPHIIYGGKIARLKTELEKKIKWCIDNPTKSIAKADLDFDFTINGEKWQEGLIVPMPYTKPFPPTENGRLGFSLQIGLHNVSNQVIDSSNYHLSLIIPEMFSATSKAPDIDTMIANGQHKILRLTNHRNLFPDDWNSAAVHLDIENKYLPRTTDEFTLRLFSEIGAKDYKFTLNFLPRNKSG